ncbi:MAG: exodeoxyribonuclease III [Myxococcales bacterium]|nr:exodeoxyribonuclease III [Myxococcales bacterium]MDD9965929.1 exodeoxyribonuclease III [Myxococcales bacterium]
MKIATWNVNSVKARKDRLLAWLATHEPEIVCLQELKTTDEAFPRQEVEASGYEAIVFGQKTYNGVAILTRMGSSEVKYGMNDEHEDDEARIVSARIANIRILSVYVPNGKATDSDKFIYKLQWLRRLQAYLQREVTPEEPVCLCGDLNIAPDERDVARPEEWKDSVLCVPPVREAFAELIGWGLVDVFRQHHAEGGKYSWWDYRMLGFPKNNGLRIDHVLATRALAEACSHVAIDRNERKGKKPSDHAPVVATFDWNG